MTIRRSANNKRIIIAATALLLAAAMTLPLASCKKKATTDGEESGTNSFDAVTTELVVETAEPEVEYPEPSYAHGSAFSFVKKSMGTKPQYINPLTGNASQTDLTNTRPVAIMINNISQAMPQIGISGADVLYECLAEGGITRLLMVTRDYASLGTIGSIRSSREYYIDFAMNHDAIYVHAGGSDEAYSQILRREIDHLDGVRADARTGRNVSGTVFYRDPDRLKTMSYEHTLVTTGERIANGVAEMGYTTTVSAGFNEPIKPIDWGWGVSLNGENATHIKVPYRSNTVSEYEYDAATGRYLRYQYNHQPHIDGTTDEQLAFENIIILKLDHRNTGDSYGHLAVSTVGDGEGWYITGGKRIPIRWSKVSQSDAMTISDMEGNPIIVNQGKTVINIADSGVYSSVTFN